MKKPLIYSLLPALCILSSTFLRAQDPATVSPDVYTIKLENESVRILEMKLEKGSSDQMHHHPPSSVHVVKGGTVLINYPNGESNEVVAADNEIMWHEGRTHQIKNIGNTDIHVIIVENKTMEDQPQVFKFYKERTKPISSESNSYKLLNDFKKLYNKHNVKVVGLWVNTEDPHEQYFMTAYKNESHYKKFVESMREDPTYQEMSSKIENDRESIEVVTLKPVLE